MESWVLYRVSAAGDVTSAHVQQVCWVLVVVLVSFLGVFSLPLLMLVVYLFHRFVVKQRFDRWTELSVECRDAVLAITQEVSPRTTDLTDFEWFGHSDHFNLSLQTTIESIRINNPRMHTRDPFYETLSIFGPAITPDALALAQWSLLRAVDRYLNFAETKANVEVMLQDFMVKKRLYDEQMNEKKEQLRHRLRKELKWRKDPAEEWEESNWLKKWWRNTCSGLSSVPPPPSAMPPPDGDSCCCICLEEYDSSKDMIQAKCRHVFHEDCLIEWLKLKTSNKCPYCRADILKPTFLQQFFSH
ncbi:hypothetical protein DYB25_007500 [Aphanomyces astaci]|uniref:RING-type domain-containing protein n=1 Tax=Aphanomyces astaci TaxID=112090 RepID=A0A397ECE1_APHAT|nr:hypothetical protein DYB25_007500 [Aphanomyces astaci]RHY62828.1 hypothetical protein DYB34_003613 [Aphanomyces astaci]RHY80185.1 hypothetical protein DYB30_008746 [Aphanomyces astaci]RHZ13780.1 hypothetical protein DYB26_003369 [Aphanomyces astaci]RHZ34190.1 hypothetical protein DYB31_001838 [Aphanomyces astaci]